MKSKYLKPALVICILIIIAIVVSFLTREKVKYNEGYVNGNTAGNLYNGGMFCEHNGTIFFANPNDGNRLYSMDSNGENLKKLSNDVANFINADDNYVYYVRNNVGQDLDYDFFSFYRNALCRIDHNGKNETILDTDPCNYATLIGNYIYYLHYDKKDASTLYKVKIDGTDKKQVRKESMFTCCTDGQYFYYNGNNSSGSIFRFDTASDSAGVIYEGNCYKPTVDENGSDIYFIDGNQNTALVHTNTNFGETTVVTTDQIDTYNVYGDYIFYQKYDGENSGICMIKNDGTGYMMIKKGTFKEIHVTNDYVFFTDYYSGDAYYIIKSMPDNVLHFSPKVLK